MYHLLIFDFSTMNYKSLKLFTFVWDTLYKTREDLGVTKDDFEMVCVEFLSQTDKNTICCCVDRHPNTDVQEFLDFIDNLLQKVTKERKSVLLMGDFNLNLLNYEIRSDTNDLMNSVISYSLLPSSCILPELLSTLPQLLIISSQI